MNYAKLGYVFFLTAVMAGLLYLLILKPVTLSQDSRAIIETVLGSLAPILMHVINSVFHIIPAAPVPPTQPPQAAPIESKP